MVNPQVSLLDFTIEAGIPGDVMRALIDDKHIVSVPRHDGFLVDMVYESIEEDSNKHVMRIRMAPYDTA